MAVVIGVGQPDDIDADHIQIFPHPRRHAPAPGAVGHLQHRAAEVHEQLGMLVIDTDRVFRQPLGRGFRPPQRGE